MNPTPPVCVKRPGESRLYSIDFADLLGTGETISSVTSVTATTPDGATALTLGTPTTDGRKVLVRISAGSGDHDYHITAKVATSASNTLEDCAILRVTAC